MLLSKLAKAGLVGATAYALVKSRAVGLNPNRMIDFLGTGMTVAQAVGLATGVGTYASELISEKILPYIVGTNPRIDAFIERLGEPVVNGAIVYFMLNSFSNKKIPFRGSFEVGLGATLIGSYGSSIVDPLLT